MEKCLNDILIREGWDLQTFEMPKDIRDLIDDAMEIFLTTFYDGRCNMVLDALIANTFEQTTTLETKINYLRSLPQPAQRTAEWYSFRHGLITASNAYKAFEGNSTVNQLIYEKCLPLKTISSTSTTEDKMVNVTSPLHWGQKYEPLSVLVYEELYGTTVEDFGCIRHPKYTFLGASPDGINVKKGSSLYGRMLEIKNVVNREITGVPKKEYWIQTQLQMEVCDLDECDFLETKFVEYPGSAEFEEDDDGTHTDRTKKNELKGLILYFNTSEGKPYYVYKGLNIKTRMEVDAWEQTTIENTEAEKNKFWIKTIYWKLEILSCVLIQRNHQWFSDNIQQLQNVWSIIERERETGYEHRAPKKRVAREGVPRKSPDSLFGQGCLISLVNQNDC
jgi:putative phage-type endonuclease